ncbi:uncharacterized protein L201_002457 [Kwoniella dendrophila CBS 6074]|uniref:SH3 domain-containing protein n=1 Tax=Kwoniella dendrophila CBS 6074 TaxID=1295534 RepID=A0AAX4JSG5_9TREE
MIDIIWIVYLTSEEDSFFYNLLNSGGNGGLSATSRRMHSAPVAHRDSVSGFGNSGGEMGIGGIGGGIHNNNNMARGISSHSIDAGGIGGGYSTGGIGGGGGYVPTATEGTPQKAKSISRNNYSPGGGEEPEYKHRAKAMYAYSASPDDPNEVSFAKGDILDVLDNTGKWFQVRTPTGATGIAPSNYLTLL